jgi:hypothetical protein
VNDGDDRPGCAFIAMAVMMFVWLATLVWVGWLGLVAYWGLIS